MENTCLFNRVNQLPAKEGEQSGGVALSLVTD